MSKKRPAPRDAAFERRAREVASDFAQRVADAQRGGIMADDLAALRHLAQDELQAQQATIDHLNHEVSVLKAKRIELSHDRKACEIIRRTDILLAEMRWLRDTTMIVRDAYRDGLEVLNAIEPELLTADDSAVVRAIDKRLAELRASQVGSEEKK